MGPRVSVLSTLYSVSTCTLCGRMDIVAESSADPAQPENVVPRHLKKAGRAGLFVFLVLLDCNLLCDAMVELPGPLGTPRGLAG